MDKSTLILTDSGGHPGRSAVAGQPGPGDARHHRAPRGSGDGHRQTDGHRCRKVASKSLLYIEIARLEAPKVSNSGGYIGLSDGEDVSTTELLRRMGQALGRPARLVPVPASWLKLAAAMVGKSDVAQRLCGSLQVDIEKTRRLLGWTPPLSLDEGLKKAAEGLRV